MSVTKRYFQKMAQHCRKIRSRYSLVGANSMECDDGYTSALGEIMHAAVVDLTPLRHRIYPFSRKVTRHIAT